MRKYKISLITLMIIFVTAICSLAFSISASAARVVDLNGSTVFYAVNGASVTAFRETVGQDYTDYAMFSFGEDDDKVTFRKNLAYSWFEKDDSVTDGNVGKNVKFSMTLGFNGVDFEKFSVKFESQQSSKTESGVSTNYVTFVKVGDGKVSVVIGADDNAQVSASAHQFNVLDGTNNPVKFTISFGDYANGGYEVSVSDGAYSQNGKFENVGGTYAKYVSSSNKSPVTPLTFFATFDENQTNEVANMVLYSMNGQSFKLLNVNREDDGSLTSGQVEDTAAPVVCFNESVSYVKMGDKLDLDYTVIDVLASSPRTTVYYYVLTGDMAADSDFGYNVTVSQAEENDELVSPFNKATSSDTVEMNVENAYQITQWSVDDSSFKAYSLIKVYLNVTDVIGTNGVKSDVFLDWYVADTATTKYDVNGSDFIAVAEDKQGISYSSAANNATEYLDAVESIRVQYQAKIDASISDKTLYAGSKNYFYLPSLEDCFSDNLDAYTDLKFSIYYYSSSQKSNTALSSSSLAIPIAESGSYVFTVFVADRNGNDMWYVDENGEVQTFKANDVWTMFDDEDKIDYLPWFEFEVEYTPASIEPVESRPSGYVGTTYDSIEFEINGVSSSYNTEYYLYLFDRENYTKDVGAITYKEFVEKVDELYANSDTRAYFTTIKALAEMQEGDPYYEQFKDYKWNKTALSFVPQDDNSFYAVRLTVTDKDTDVQTTKLMAIRVSAKAESLMGENEWLKNNLTSIILFSVSGVCLIAIIVLLVVKPKNVDLDKIEIKTKKK